MNRTFALVCSFCFEDKIMRVPGMNSCGRFESENIEKNSVSRDTLNEEGKEI